VALATGPDDEEEEEPQNHGFLRVIQIL